MGQNTTTLLTYLDIRHLLYLDELDYRCYGENMPMNKSPIKIHKCVNNTIPFRVMGPDRKPVNLVGCGDVYFRLINTITKEVILEKLGIHGNDPGFIFFQINDGDVSDIQVGMYNAVVVLQNSLVHNTIEPGEVVSEAFYTDFSRNINLMVEVTDQAQPEPLKSTELNEDDWTPYITEDPQTGLHTRRFYSKAIPGGRVSNHKNSVHTFSIKAEDFSGSVSLYATLDNNPSAQPSDVSWFRVSLDSISDAVVMSHFTGIDAFTITNNAMWFKFVYTPDVSQENPGKISQILFRG